MSIDEEKQALRKRMRALRLVVDQKQGPDAARGLITTFMARWHDIELAAGVAVAGYWPIATEIDVRPLLARIEAKGPALALPVLLAGDLPLIFRRWRPLEDVLVAGAYGTAHPPATAPAVEPDVVLVPGLAFDGEGYRLGQGGGHFDRTLAALRRRRRIVAIGVGYAAQRLASLPHDARDERMDWLLSETSFERMAG